MMENPATFDAQGVAGPARTQEEADADQAAGLAKIDQKRARLRDLQAGFEADGYPEAKARTLAAIAYAHEE